MAVTTSNGNGFALYNGVKLPVIPCEYKEDIQIYIATADGLPSDAAYFIDGLADDGSGIYSNIFYLYTVYDSVVQQLISGGISNAVVGTWFQVPNLSFVLTLVPLWDSNGDTDFVPVSYPEISLDGMTVIEWDGVDSGGSYINAGSYRVSDYFEPAVCYGVFVGDNGSFVSDRMIPAGIGDNPGWLAVTSDSFITAIGKPAENYTALFDARPLGEDSSSPYYNGFTRLFAYSLTEAPPDDGGGGSTYDRTAFLSGLAMGLCGKGNPTFEGSGKMLYNGVVLPALPEWDKAAYPYAYISLTHYSLASHNSYFLDVFSSYEYTTSSGGTHCIHHKKENTLSWKIPVDENEIPTTDVWEDRVSVGSYASFANGDWYKWSNFDFLAEDGQTILFAASEPVPVEDAFSKGYHVGAALRRKRVLPNSNE